MKKCFEFPDKMRYNTLRDATTAIIMSGTISRQQLRAYHCDTCNGWHLTSKPE